MRYNKTYIDDFTEDNYNKYLNDYNMLVSLSNLYNKRYDDSIKIDVRIILFKESLDHYIFKKLSEDPSYINSKQMINYLNYFALNYRKNSLEYACNILFLEEKTRNIIFRKLAPEFKNELIKTNGYNDGVNGTLDRKFDKIIDKIRNKEDISQDQLDFVSEYFSRSRIIFREYDVFLKFVFGEMRDTNLVFNTKVQEACATYFSYFFKEGLKDVRYVFGNTDNKKDINGPGHSSGSGKYIAINKEYFKNVNLKSIDNSDKERLRKGTDISFFLIVLMHEMTHQKQREKIDKKFFDNQGMAYIIHQITNSFNHDYSYNHDSDEIEIDANLVGWNKTGAFVNEFYSGKDKDKFVGNCTVNRHCSDFRRYFSYKKDANDNMILYSDYDIENLTRIIKTNPDLLNRYPMLEEFYNESGLKLSFIYSKNLYTESCGREFINYFYTHNGIKGIIKYLDKEKLTEAQVTNLISNLMYFILWQFKAYEALSYVLNHESIGEYRHMDHFDDDDVMRLSNIYKTRALYNYKNVLPLLSKIKVMYPGSVSYINNMINYVENSRDRCDIVSDDIRINKL